SPETRCSTWTFYGSLSRRAGTSEIASGGHIDRAAGWADRGRTVNRQGWRLRAPKDGFTACPNSVCPSRSSAYEVPIRLLFRWIIPLGMPGIQLTRTPNLVRLAQHFVPVRAPAWRSADGENYREQGSGDTDRLQDDAGVEVHVRVEFALDEVIVFQGDFFQAAGDAEQWIVLDAQVFQDFVADLPHDFGTRVEVLVNAVAEAHQAEGVVLVLGAFDELVDVGLVTDLVEHGQHGFVGAAVCWAPQRGDAGGDAGEGVGAGGAGQADSRSRSVLFVVGVQQEDRVHGLDQNRADLGLLAWGAEHHVEEVFC